MLNHRRNIRFALRAAVLMVLASLALAPGLAFNHAGFKDLLGHIVPTLQAPAITLAPPVLSPAPEYPLAPPAAQPGHDASATPATVDAGKPAQPTSGAIAIQQPAARPTFAARPSGSGFGNRPAITRGGIGSGGSAGSPEKSVASAQQTFAPAERGDRSNPDAGDDTDETDTSAPAETDGNPSLADNHFQDRDFHDRDTDEFLDEEFAPEFNDDTLLSGDKPTGDQRPVVEVPEPSGLALLAVGLFCLTLCRRMQR